jgi:hypothetical protein
MTTVSPVKDRLCRSMAGEIFLCPVSAVRPLTRGQARVSDNFYYALAGKAQPFRMCMRQAATDFGSGITDFGLD